MKLSNFKYATLLLIVLGIVVFFPAMAQPPIGPPPTATPVDGGLSALLVACAGYGAKRINDRRKAAKK
jgi:hypothetical protein